MHLLEYDQEAGKQWGRCCHTEYKSFLSHIPLKNKINDVSVFYISLIFRLYIHFIQFSLRMIPYVTNPSLQTLEVEYLRRNIEYI